MKLVVSLIIVVCSVVVSSVVLAASAASDDLIENSARYDNKVVEYSGEVVGDVMIRGDFAWINVLDNSTAIGIWITKEQARSINTAGNYFNKGDIVKVSGIFNKSCLQHGGDLDIHAKELTILSSGKKIKHSIDMSKIYLIVIFSIISLCLLLIYKNISKP